MENPSPEPNDESVREELQRIFLSVILVFLLIFLVLLLEPPISILAWFLNCIGFLSLLYVALAVRTLLRRYPSPDQSKQ